MNPFAHFEDQFGHLQLSDNDAALHVFLAGWNSAMMEMMQRVNKMPFGDDTRASFAVYFQNQMVNVDAIEKPAQRQPLTLEEIAEVAERMEATDAASSFWREFARAIEAAHGIKGEA